MKRQIVIDTDEKFVENIQSLCNPKKVTTESFSSSNVALPLIEIEQPNLIFLNLDVPDVNEFIVHDLLKKCCTEFTIPVLITYSDSSEGDLDKYKTLIHKSKAYLKKPISETKLIELLIEYLGKECLKEEKEKAEESKKENIQEENDDIEKETDSLFDTLLNSEESEATKKNDENFIKIEDTIADVVDEDVDEFFVLDETSNVDLDEAEETHVPIKKDVPEGAIYLEDEKDEMNKKYSDKEKIFDAKNEELEDTLEKITYEKGSETEQLKSEKNQLELDKKNSLDESIEEKENQISALKSKIESLTAKNRSLENEISNLKETLEKMEEILNGATSLIPKKKKK